MAQNTQSTGSFALAGYDTPAVQRIPIRAYMFREDGKYIPLYDEDLVLLVDAKSTARTVYVRKSRTAITALLYYVIKETEFPVESLGSTQWVARRTASITLPNKLKSAFLNWTEGRSQIVFVCDESRVPTLEELKPWDDHPNPDGWRSGTLARETWRQDAIHDWFQADFPKVSSCKGKVIKSYNYQSPSGQIYEFSEDLFTVPQYQAPGNWPADPSIYNPYGEGPSVPFS